MTTDNGRPLAATVGAQHARIRALLAEATDPAGEERGERFAVLTRTLAIQTAAEHLFLQRTASELPAMFARLEQLGPEDPYFLNQLGLLEEAVEEHTTYAEKTEVPSLEGSLRPEALRNAQEGMALVDVLLDDPVAVPVDGGFARQYDAALNALEARTAYGTGIATET